MKVSLNWIKDYVDLPADMDLKRLAYDLTMSTVEVEGAEDLARRFDHMLVGRIVEVCPHPNADKLQICRTDIGGGDIRIEGQDAPQEQGWQMYFRCFGLFNALTKPFPMLRWRIINSLIPAFLRFRSRKRVKADGK